MNPALWCTVIDQSNWYHPTFFAMVQIIGFKILLVVSPATFIAMNKPVTKYICWIQLIFSFVYILIHVLINGHKCAGKAFLVTIKDILDLKVSVQNEKNFPFTSFPLGLMILFLVFVIELILKVYVMLKKRRKMLNIKHRIITHTNITQNLEQRQENLELEGGEKSIQKSNSYNNTLILVTCILMQALIFQRIIQIKDQLVRLLLSTVLSIFYRATVNILPAVWIVTHDPIKTYVSHKFNQIKINYLRQ